jgi:hypothetical protein
VIFFSPHAAATCASRKVRASKTNYAGSAERGSETNDKTPHGASGTLRGLLKIARNNAFDVRHNEESAVSNN